MLTNNPATAGPKAFEILRYDALMPKISPCSRSLLLFDKIAFNSGIGKELVMPNTPASTTKIGRIGNSGIKKNTIARPAIAVAKMSAKLNRWTTKSTAKIWVRTLTTPINVKMSASICED